MYCSAPARLATKSSSRMTTGHGTPHRSEGSTVRRFEKRPSDLLTIGPSDHWFLAPLKRRGVAEDKEQAIDAGVTDDRHRDGHQDEIAPAAFEETEPQACTDVRVCSTPGTGISPPDRAGVHVRDEARLQHAHRPPGRDDSILDRRSDAPVTGEEMI